MTNKDFMKHYGFLGLGAFGGNITRQFEAEGYVCIIANSSAEDLSQVKDAKNKLHFDGGSGCHKDRHKSKELLKNNYSRLIGEIKAKMPEVETLFICASSAGGTGSGMLVATAKILKSELGINISIVTVLPSKSEQFKAYANTIELYQEIEKFSDIGAIFILDNNKLTNKMAINRIFYEHLHALLRNENGSALGCTDRGEINEMLKTGGMAIISVLSRESANVENLLASIKTSKIYAPIEQDRVIKYFCLMNCVNNIISVEEIYSDIGIPVSDFIGYDAHSTVCMLAGLTLPKTRLNEIRKTAEANSEIIKKNMETAKTSIFGENIDFIDIFAVKAVPKEAKKKSSLEILDEFL